MEPKFRKLSYIYGRLINLYRRCSSVEILEVVDPHCGESSKSWIVEVHVGHRLFIELSIDGGDRGETIVVRSLHVDHFSNCLGKGEVRFSDPVGALRSVINRVELVRTEFHATRKAKRR